jgi:hypothetical protein
MLYSCHRSIVIPMPSSCTHFPAVLCCLAQLWIFAKTICDCAGDCPRCQPYATEASRVPSPTNPNYLVRIMIVRVGRDPVGSR